MLAIIDLRICFCVQSLRTCHPPKIHTHLACHTVCWTYGKDEKENNCLRPSTLCLRPPPVLLRERSVILCYLIVLTYLPPPLSLSHTTAPILTSTHKQTHTCPHPSSKAPPGAQHASCEAQTPKPVKERISYSLDAIWHWSVCILHPQAKWITSTQPQPHTPCRHFLSSRMQVFRFQFSTTQHSSGLSVQPSAKATPVCAHLFITHRLDKVDITFHSKKCATQSYTSFAAVLLHSSFVLTWTAAHLLR